MPTKKRKPVYVGNNDTKEFHSVKRQTPECHVDLITAENRVEFQRGRDAIARGLDACAHCTRYWKSKDNK